MLGKAKNPVRGRKEPPRNFSRRLARAKDVTRKRKKRNRRKKRSLRRVGGKKMEAAVDTSLLP
jgi:hypothetical protein